LQKRVLNNERPTTRQGIENALVRSHLHNVYFRNDADVYFFKQKTKLTYPEILTLACVVALISDVVFTSMPIQTHANTYQKFFSTVLFDKQIEDLVLVQSNPIFKVKFQINNELYQLCINLTNQKQSIDCEHEMVFSSTTKSHYYKGDRCAIMPHSIELWLIVSVQQIALAGSNVHLLPNHEVKSCIITDNEITLEYMDSVNYPFTTFFSLPLHIDSIIINNKKYFGIKNKITNIVTYYN
jgi:hypothetical protein